MHKQMWIFGVAALAAAAACSPKDRNFITGTSAFTSVAVALDPTTATIAVGDSVPFTTVVTLVPQGTVVVNGTDNVQYTFSNADVAHINDSGYIQGDATGSTVLTATYTDNNHSFATTSTTTTITVRPSSID